MIEPNPDNQFVFSVFSTLGAVSAFILFFSVFRILFLVFVKKRIDAYWQNALVVWVSFIMMFAFMGLGLSTQYTQAEMFEQVDYSWGWIGALVGAAIATFVVIVGYISIRGTKYVSEFISTNSGEIQ